MVYMKIYKASDNSELSGVGNFDNSVDVRVRLDTESMESVRLYAQAESGYKITSVVGSFERIDSGVTDTTNKWSYAPDNEGSAGTYGDWGGTINIGTVEAGAGGRVYFWVRGRATDDESVHNDTNTALKFEGEAEATS